MEENNKLIPIANNSLVQKATISLAITNKLIAENNKQLVIEIFRKNPKLFIDTISRVYPLDLNTLLEFKDVLNWKLLSDNENLEWYLGTENPFEKELNCSTILDYEHIRDLAASKKNYYLIDIFLDKWDWSNLSRNKSLPWTIEFIEKYKNKFLWSSLSYIESLPWSIEFIEKFEDKWNWYYRLSDEKKLPWSIDLIEKFKDKWNWSYLSYYNNLPFSEELIEKFIDRWDWEKLSENKNLPCSIEFIGKFIDNWDWQILSRNENLSWSLEFIEKYEDKWNWTILSQNKSLPWSSSLIDKYLDKWDWEFLYLKVLRYNINMTHKYAENIKNVILGSFKDYIDDDLVIELLEEIKTGKLKIK